MNFQLHYLINSVLCWVIVLIAIAGYFITLKRIGQKWPFWALLSVGWALIATSNTFVLFRIGQGTFLLLAIWLSSYVLVFASLVLLFVKFIQMSRIKNKVAHQSPNGSDITENKSTVIVKQATKEVSN
jgi:hypothetical protein